MTDTNVRRIPSRASLPAGLVLDPELFARCFPGRTAHPDHFPLGNTCPAVVLSRNPWLIAVGTDLNAAGENGKPYPVISVVSQPLDLMTGGPPPVGARLATAALYYGPGAEGHWDSFDPVAAGCGCSDETAIARTLAAIDGEAWASFLDAVRGLPTPYQPGKTYKMRGLRTLGAAKAPPPRARRTDVRPPRPSAAAPAVHRMSPWVAVFVTAILGGLGALLVETYRTWWSAAGAAPFWAGAAWVLWTIGRRRVEIGPRGLAWTDKGSTQSARWEDVAGYRVDAIVGEQGPWHNVAAEWIARIQERRGRRFSKATDRVIVTLDFRDGRALALHQTYARSWDLFSAVLDQVDPRIAERMQGAVAGGETVDCGSGIALAPYGVVTPDEVWAWDEVESATTIDGRVTVVARGARYWLKEIRSPYATAWLIEAFRLRAD